MRSSIQSRWLIWSLLIIITVFTAKNTYAQTTKTYTVNGVSFKMVFVEGGTFTMGATAEQGSDKDDEQPAHQVTLSSYSIGETEVTQALWVAVMGSNPSCFNQNGNSDYDSYHSGYNYGTNLQRPVESVSWNDCQEFIAKLNELTGANFRLPTEAEWEYAARGGNKSKGYKYAGSNTIGNVAWYWDNIPSHSSGNSGYGPQTVATKSPNELGLYDMSGNVYEWCQDWYDSDYYSNSPSSSPTGPISGTDRVDRGGSWYNEAMVCRVANRGLQGPTYRGSGRGLRLAFPQATSINLEPNELTICLGDSYKLEAIVLPADANNTLQWISSKPSVASVDQNGNITALSTGFTIVMASTTDGSNLSAACLVTVQPRLASSITLNHEELTVLMDQTAQLTATVLPENATDKSVTWNSSEPTVATVDQNGLVSPVSVGHTNITASTNDGSNLTASCHVTINPVLVTSVTLSDTSTQLFVGGAHQLSATVLPENATFKNLTWTSSDTTIATVSNQGVVIGVKVGNATISATTTDGSDITATCEVTVMPVLATSVIVNPIAVTITAGETTQLNLTIAPDNATYKTATWVSSDEAVAIVDENGLVTGITSGQALITATTTDGTELSTTSVVTVLPRKANGITITPDSVTLDISGSVRLTATITPEDVESRVLLWQSSDEDVAIVTSTGMVYGVGAGQALITATTTDGSELSDTCYVTVRVPFELSAQSVAVPVNTLRNIPVIIDNHVAVKSFAFTLTVPEGIGYFGDAIAAPRCSDFNITTTYNADSTMMHIEGEMTNQAMSAGKAPFVLLPIKSSKYIDTFVLSLSDISFVSTNDGVGTQELDDITVTMRVLNLGDVNGDKAVDVGDVNALINYILGVETDLTNFGVGDMNNDGIIDVADVNLIINLILGLGDE